MDETTTKRKDRRSRRRLLAFLIAGTALISVTGAFTSLALFTSQQQVSGISFTSGTIVIGVNPGSALLTATAMMPGDTVNGTEIVSNTGTAQLRYSISGIATNPDTKGIASQITITVRTLGTSCAAWDGTQLFSGVVGYAATNMVGDPTPGAQAGDRTLNFGVNETLCFRATLPLATGNAYQGATTTMTFTFDAEQTANNP